MTRAIWKEPLADIRPQANGSYALCEVSLPAGAEILHVDDQRGQFCVWFSVPMEKAVTMETFTFALVPTGGDIPPSPSNAEPRYLGTVMQNDGVFVWHIFVL